MDLKDLPPLHAEILNVSIHDVRHYIGVLRDAHKIHLQMKIPTDQRELATLWTQQHMEDAKQAQLKYYSRCTLDVATLQLPSVESKDLHKLTRG